MFVKRARPSSVRTLTVPGPENAAAEDVANEDTEELQTVLSDLAGEDARRKRPQRIASRGGEKAPELEEEDGRAEFERAVAAAACALQDGPTDDRSVGSATEESAGTWAEAPRDSLEEVYHGQKNYVQFFHAPERRVKGLGGFGARPIAAPDNVRVVTRMDYQPDVCKDWRETGYCGYGDTCKFLHDRSGLSPGVWEAVDRSWRDFSAVGRPGRTASSVAAASGSDALADVVRSAQADASLRNVPFACFLCRGPFVAPVVTLCGHVFCSACALGRREPTCAVCSADLAGIFNKVPRALQAKIERKVALHRAEIAGDAT
jgi:RING finger protein 113A